MATSKDMQDQWQVIDAQGQSVGRLAVDVARLLQGKNRPQYTPNVIMGDGVIVLNAGKLKITGKKLLQKMYYRHSGYPGGLKVTSLESQLADKPEIVIRRAVKGMLPKNTLGRAMLKRLRVYSDLSHPHQGQTDKPATSETDVTSRPTLSRGLKKKLNRLRSYTSNKEKATNVHPSFAELLETEVEGGGSVEVEAGRPVEVVEEQVEVEAGGSVEASSDTHKEEE